MLGQQINVFYIVTIEDAECQINGYFWVSASHFSLWLLTFAKKFFVEATEIAQLDKSIF